MRNAATFDDDLGYDAPPRKTPSRSTMPRKSRGASAPAKKKKGKRRRFDVHRVARYAALGMAAAMSIGIMVNALMLQKGHHPAPLFGGHSTPATSAAALKPAPPLPPPRAVQIEPAAPVPPSTTPSAKPHRAAATQDVDAPSGDDAIARLIAGGGATTVSAKSDAKTVLGVQRALAKLGFKVPATGASGAATRKAVEAFERDRHMTVKGEITRRLVKVLSAESGIRID